MIVERLELVDFRNYAAASFRLTAGTTVVVGDNGQGKTNFAEALAYLATLSSFRGAPPEALVRVGATAAVVRAEVRDDDGRASLIEAELVPAGRNRVQVNRQRLGRARDLLGVVRVTVFSPDDLTLVKGGPADRRRFLDDTLVALAVKYDAARLELDRIVRQRNTLLRQVGGRLDEAAATTLDVWDAKLSEAGERFGHARATLVERIQPHVARGLRAPGRRADAGRAELRPAVAPHRPGRGAGRGPRPSTCGAACRPSGPHRDELGLTIDGLPAAHPRLAGRAAHAWRWRCASAPTASSPSAPARRRCWCSTTCCPSSTPAGPPRCSATCPPARS